MVKCLLESDVSQFLHISGGFFVCFFFFGLYSFMRCFVCNQINNGYCTFLLEHKLVDISSLDKCE